MIKAVIKNNITQKQLIIKYKIAVFAIFICQLHQSSVAKVIEYETSRKEFLKINVLIVDEVSMASDKLFTFTNDMLAHCTGTTKHLKEFRFLWLMILLNCPR